MSGTNKNIYRSRAPLRIGLAGGGSDVSPFPELHGGAILNSTISCFARATIIPRADSRIIVTAEDREEKVEWDLTDGPMDVSDPILKLQKGVINRMLSEYGQRMSGFELSTSIDVSTGSGLGTSSTLVVATLGVFLEWLSISMDDYEVARLAFSIEREDLAMDGGKQDQYAATFGGVNYMEFQKDGRVLVNPLRIRPEIINELESMLLLMYTDTTRESATVIRDQRKNIESANTSAIDAVLNLKAQAAEMKDHLLRGNLAEIGRLLNEGWQEKKKMAEGITNPMIDKMYETALKAGATGGKISGAGGGGFMIFFCPGQNKYKTIRSLQQLGAHHQLFNFYKNGLTTWTSRVS